MSVFLVISVFATVVSAQYGFPGNIHGDCVTLAQCFVEQWRNCISRTTVCGSQFCTNRTFAQCGYQVCVMSCLSGVMSMTCSYTGPGYACTQTNSASLQGALGQYPYGNGNRNPVNFQLFTAICVVGKIFAGYKT